MITMRTPVAPARRRMKPIKQHISVPFSYEVSFTRDLFGEGDEALAAFLARTGPMLPHPLLVYVDSGLAKAHPRLEGMIEDWTAAHPDLVNLASPVMRIPGGEVCKDGFTVAERVLADIEHCGLCRQSLVIVAGGGAVLDAVGFGASLAHRGIRQIRVPSTVLAQADSGVGVKNGVNLHGKKNFAGVFAPPAAVINDLNLLDTLSDRDWLAGVAEAFKVAIIRDRAFLDRLIEATPDVLARDTHAMEHLVRRCAELHCEHIGTSGDPFEMGSARPLDFGHWSAHRIEGLTGYELRHGEAVSIGMALDCEYAARIGRLTREEADLVIDALAAINLPVHHPVLERRDASGRLSVLAGLREFREHLGGDLCVTLPDGLGKKVEVHEMDEALLEASAEALQARDR
jgi:3-dehydroquinate synthase